MTTAPNFSAAPSISNAALEAASAALVTLRDVSKRYANGMQALSGVNLTVGDGEFVSLLGPSGCGKSTLLRLIAGLGATTGGAIEWPRGTRDSGGAPHPDLGFVFQEPTLMPWATVFNNVFLPLKLAGISRKEAVPRINDALAMVGLERFADAYPRQLSGGMKMRVSISRALVTSPTRAAARRTLRGARRDHAISPQQRPSVPLATTAMDGDLRHPQRFRIGLFVAAYHRNACGAGPRRFRSADHRPLPARRRLPHIERLQRILPHDVGGARPLHR